MADKDDTGEQENADKPSAPKAKAKRETFLSTSNIASLREEPEGAKQTFGFSKDTIRDVTRSEYLLLGFDTEYQSLEEFFDPQSVKEGRAKYEVLSYQFHAINDNGAEWSGIVIPDEGRRLSLTEFIVYALAKGQVLGETIPKSIVLVGHYNRADIPAFEERGQIFGQLNNVRNSLISLGLPITVKVSFDDDEDEPLDLKVYVRDTMLLAPAGRKSLAEIGKLLGIEKMKLADTPEEELLLKRNMKNVRAYDWERFKAYALLDAEISAKYFQSVTTKFQDATGNEFVPTALSNIGMKLLIQEWKGRKPPVDADEIVGREQVRETLYNEHRGQFTTKTVTTYFEEISWFQDFVTECYHGGRNEQLWFGPSFEDNWSDYDLSSAYPTAMALIGKPNWKAIEPIGKIDQVQAEDLAFACVDFEFPPSVRYPTLPVRTQNGIVFPLAGRSYCGAPEIEAARRLNCKMTLRFGVSVPQDHDDPVFFPFIKDSINRRANSPSKIEQEFWKEITNSCYGKTAQGLRDKRMFNLREKKNERVQSSKISNPFYAAFITSFVRAVVGEIMNAIPQDKIIFSVTTDGFITNASDEEMALAKQGPLSTVYSKARADLTENPEILAEKHNVRQVLGWRTRGQATIKEGTNDSSKQIVLAKAGIKPPIWTTETTEQNNYILETFFERTVDSTIEIDIHTSLREMTLFDADLVSKKSVKRTSMEFDFKRKPKATAMAALDLPGVGKGSYRHIAFSTAPWPDVSHFQAVRKFRDDYRRKGGSCIKTVEDYKEFAELFDMISSLAPKDQGYLRKENGDLKRLQRDLCRAFKWGCAGLGSYADMSAADFASVLNEIGLEGRGVLTKRADVENGKKVRFASNSTPRSKAVLEMMDALQIRFPEFTPTELLSRPRPGDVCLSDATKGECKFIDRLLPSDAVGMEEAVQ